ncbi:MAG: hypothetical protein ABS68_06545 [Niastella sp. SCN 39-18]|nr:hypothetical protein [Sphingobacteriales bacterium]ODT53220.1 MAG: hypothetical protein ABS68_06545 [Niastella sp. SCN 39-18]OJW08141.1 MAG: hypothetical protein BGO53_04615 [Sphingobacteriales bacterium 39-19]
MKKHVFVFVFIFLSFSSLLWAQKNEKQDTFFLNKKKGLLGRIGKSISRNPAPAAVRIINPFEPFSGEIIREIEIIPLGFDRDINDSTIIKKSFFTDVANALHKETKHKIISQYLLFKTGDRVLPFLMADNEKYLRDQEFLKDARIIIKAIPGYNNSVKVYVITKDVFSLGGNVKMSSKTKGLVELKEQNLAGSGNYMDISAFFEKERDPSLGFGSNLTFRNFKGTFLNWTTGFKTYNNSFSSSKAEENSFYIILEKPLVSRYTRWTGGAEFDFNITSNGYHGDSVYHSDFAYSRQIVDVWGGYNIGAGIKKESDNVNRLRHFIGERIFYTKFYDVPGKYQNNYNFNYADINGLLFSYTLYKQNFFRTNFIYGFGRNEDVPEGISATVVGGYTNKSGKKRAYYGLGFEGTGLSPRGFFTNYVLRSGAFVNNKKLEDIDVLARINHFTRLRELSAYWKNRNFIDLSFTRQINYRLNEPLYLRSEFGLPYFRDDSTTYAETRTTLKVESVFFNMHKFLGFRFAPFVFGGVSFLNPLQESFKKTHAYSAMGAGVRSRNENLIFGSMELRGYYFPRTVGTMRNFRVDFTTNLRFKYNSQFIRKPDFIFAN